MKKSKRIYPISAKKITVGHMYEDTTQAVKLLESAWNNIPQDLAMEDRETFFELSAQFARTLKNFSETDLDVN